jgi:hypothetical protein
VNVRSLAICGERPPSLARRGTRKLRWAWLGPASLAAGSVLSGCFSTAPPASQFPSARAALTQLQAEHACSRALRGEAKLDTYHAQGRLRVGALFLVQHPESVRLDLLSPLGGTLATLTSDGERFALLDQKERAFHVGRANQCNVERYLGVPVPAAVLAQLLSGEAPILVHDPGQAQIRWEDGSYVIEIKGRNSTFERIELAPLPQDFAKPYSQQRLRVLSVRLEQQGILLYQAELKDHAAAKMAGPRVDALGIEPDVPPSGPECRAEVPGKIRFSVPLSDQDVVFEPHSVEHNPPLLDQSFTQSPPEGVRVKPSPCGL